MKLFYLFAIIMNVIKCEPDFNSTYMLTTPVHMNEELDAETQIANVTQLIYSLLVNLTDMNPDSIRIEQVKFANTDFDDYFKLDTKQISFNPASKLIRSIDLKTNTKRIDRELLCAINPTLTCQISLKLIAQLDSDEIGIEIPIIINDLNDNKPAFYQPEIKIDIDLNKPINTIKIPLKLAYDLDSSRENRIQNYSLGYLNKNGTDLIGLNLIQIKYNQRSLMLILNSSDLDMYVNTSELFELKAFDPDFQASQLIELKFIKKRRVLFHLFEKNLYNLAPIANIIKLKLNKLNKQCGPVVFSAFNTQTNNKLVRAEFQLEKEMLEINFLNTFKLNQIKLVAKCGDSNDSTLITLNQTNNTASFFNLNLVSAMNDLDINETKNNVFEFKFKSSESTTSTNSSFVTLAYLIAEQQQNQHVNDVKFKLNREINKLDDNYHDLIRLDEMRNGLYAFKLSSKYLDLIKKLNNHQSDQSAVLYTIKLNLLITSQPDLDMTIERILKLKLPSLHLIQTTQNLPIERADLSTVITSSRTTTPISISVTAATLITSFNLFNSVILITVISVILILIALGCFIVSLVLYLKSKCRQMKDIKKGDVSLPEISVKLNEKKLLKMSGSSSIELGSAESGISSGQPSSSSSSSDLSCNSSTITTTTTKNKFNLLKSDYQSNQQGGWVNTNAIMVYDVMPSKQNNFIAANQQASSSSSSTSSSNYQNSDSSNISPITTTSGVDSAMSSSSLRNKQSLLQLSAKQLETDSKDLMYKWYMTPNGNDLIKPLAVKPTPEKSDSSLNLNKDYRNEIYRNSHLIFKNPQYCQLKKSLPTSVVAAKKPNEPEANFQTYEAKPISLNKDTFSTITTATTTNSNINSSSSLDNYDTVNFDSSSSNSIANNYNAKMLANRLSTAMSIGTSSSDTTSSNKTFNKNNLSMADSEQVSSV